jgi:hypothetical protein
MATRHFLGLVLAACVLSTFPGAAADARRAPPPPALGRPFTNRASRGPQALRAPEQFVGFRVGSDNKLVRWDKIVDYMRLAAASSPRVKMRELGKTTNGNAFIVLEISSPETIANLDHFKQLERSLYFQERAPTNAERDEIFRTQKAVVLITCSIHATEIGASQMSLELVHRLATDESAAVRKILDNVIFLLVPSLNPDGQIMVTDWFTKNLGTPFESSPIPYLYHPYVGHDNNRDMYMFTQKESQLAAQLLWHDWYPVVWLDEHQMGSNGPRIFVMPATDPINPNVHPLIYRWNAIFGQSQAGALETEGREGIIYNSTYTNFWEGAMAWSGWWHNQVGLLTEVASARVAAPIEQRRALPGQQPAPAPEENFQTQARRQFENPNEPLPPPRDITPRTEYPRPWLGGRWTLRDIIDYELTATMGLLEAAADRRETLLRQIYEVNRVTVEESSGQSNPAAILVPVDTQHDPREAIHLVDTLRMAGVEIDRASAPFEVDGRTYAAGTFVIPMAQVFARYAKDILEKQTYPEVRRSPSSAPEPPYDVTAWSLGMLLGVETVFAKTRVPSSTAQLQKISESPKPTGDVSGNGSRYAFDYKGADTAIVINRLLKDGARVTFEPAHEDAPYARVVVAGASRKRLETVAAEFGVTVHGTEPGPNGRSGSGITLRPPRIGMYQPFTGGNMDEGWTRWVLEQYEFQSTALHNQDIRAGKLRQRFDAIIVPDQQPRDIVDGYDYPTIRPEYRGGIGEEGLRSLQTFVAEGGTLIAMGAACDLAIDKLPIPVRNLKRGLTRDQHFAPGTILRVQVDTTHPLGYGVAPETYGFYNNSPFFAIVEGFASHHPKVVARYPNVNVVASGWLKGEELMTGRAAVVVIEMNPGQVVLFGIRPQHRAQTHATFPMLFNALYLSGTDASSVTKTPSEP